MPPANVYRIFAAKSEINAAVVRHITAELEGAIEQIAIEAGSASQRLRTSIKATAVVNADR